MRAACPTLLTLPLAVALSLSAAAQYEPIPDTSPHRSGHVLVPEAPDLSAAGPGPGTTPNLSDALRDLVGSGTIVQSNSHAITVQGGGDTLILLELDSASAIATSRIVYPTGAEAGAFGPAVYWSADGRRSLRGVYRDGVPVGQWLEFVYRSPESDRCPTERTAAPAHEVLSQCGSFHAAAQPGDVVYRHLPYRAGRLHGQSVTRTLAGSPRSAVRFAAGMPLGPVAYYDTSELHLARDGEAYVVDDSCTVIEQTVDPSQFDAVRTCRERAFLEAIYLSIQYPLQARLEGHTGRVAVAFDVLADGSTGNFRITKPLTPPIDEEIVRCLGSIGPWEPARENAHAVSSTRRHEFDFDLEVADGLGWGIIKVDPDRSD